MKEPIDVSNEMLNAFVDDELEDEERQDLLTAQVDDARIAQAICELRVLKDLVKSARPTIEGTAWLEIPRRPWFMNWLTAAAVAFMAVLLGVAGMWYQADPADSNRQLSTAHASVDALLQASLASKQLKLVFHVKQRGNVAAEDLFAQLERMLQHASDESRNLHIQVIASGAGLSLLRKDESLYLEKVSFLSTHYDNVDFVACQRSMLRQATAEDKDINILPEALITYSGPELIKRRQRQGWATIII